MSNFYLCDSCAKRLGQGNIAIDSLGVCQCVAYPEVHAKRVMVDYNGVNGKRYDEPRDVCADFEPKEDR